MLPKKFSLLLIFSIILTLGLSISLGSLLAAWTAPASAPPEGNIAAPINASDTGQSKQGGLILNTGDSVNGLIVQFGNVGIGTTSPQAKLDVVGPVKIGSYLTIARPACNANLLGAFIFDLTENKPYVCASGGIWKSLNSDCAPVQKENGETCSSEGGCISGNCYVDTDGDRYAIISGTKKCQANPQLGTDCNDSNAALYQLLPCYNDGDGDGHGANPALSTCTGATCSVAGKVSSNDDCNDGNAAVWQLLTCYTDADGDGYGVGSPLQSVCATSCGTGKSTNNADCLDTDAQVSPAASFHTTTHATRGWDWDCDGSMTRYSSVSPIYNCVTCSVSGSSSLCPACPYSYINVSCTQMDFNCGQYKSYNICRAWRCPWAYQGYCGEDGIPLISGGSGVYKSAEFLSAGYTEGCK
ncbi:MAG: hypothetical protein WC619_04095 [Patescibacteria group bacterium]